MEKLNIGVENALGFSLDETQLERFDLYYAEMVEWNKRVNLTAVTDRDDVQTRHFLDSILVASVIPVRLLDSGFKMLDIGSGAGFPGLPLKIVFPSVTVTLMDATAKKTDFLQHIAEVLKLDGVEIRTGRAETYGHDPILRERYDIVVSRAVAKLSVLMELSLPFCRIGGLSISQKGSDIDDEVTGSLRAIEKLGGAIKGVESAVPLLGRNGALVVVEKISHTPMNYPRRIGVPMKRPI